MARLALVLLFAAPASAQELRPPTVHFETSASGVRVHYIVDPTLDEDGRGGLRLRVPEASHYSLLCDAPCDRELPRTHYALAFERNGAFVRQSEPFGVDGPTRVDVRWNDQGAVRDAGVFTLAIGAPIGVLLAILPIAIDRGTGGSDDAMFGPLVAGFAITVASVIVGLALFVQTDTATFSVAPLSDPSGVYSESWTD